LVEVAEKKGAQPCALTGEEERGKREVVSAIRPSPAHDFSSRATLRQAQGRLSPPGRGEKGGLSPDRERGKKEGAQPCAPTGEEEGRGDCQSQANDYSLMCVRRQLDKSGGIKWVVG
jgi:hypothetical protein